MTYEQKRVQALLNHIQKIAMEGLLNKFEGVAQLTDCYAYHAQKIHLMASHMAGKCAEGAISLQNSPTVYTKQ